jgi:SRSO17 transposase
MPAFEVDRTEITGFKVEDKILFNQYFDHDELFDNLEKYYNRDQYRFEVPESDLDKVEQILDEFFYDIKVVEQMENYCVVIEENSDTSEILRNTVMNTRKTGRDVFLMKDQLSVEQAQERGASKINKTGIDPEDLEWIIDRS